MQSASSRCRKRRKSRPRGWYAFGGNFSAWKKSSLASPWTAELELGPHPYPTLTFRDDWRLCTFKLESCMFGDWAKVRAEFGASSKSLVVPELNTKEKPIYHVIYIMWLASLLNRQPCHVRKFVNTRAAMSCMLQNSHQFFLRIVTVESEAQWRPILTRLLLRIDS